MQRPATGNVVKSGTKNGKTQSTTVKRHGRKAPDYTALTRLTKRKNRIGKIGMNNANLKTGKAKNNAVTKRDVRKTASPFEWDITIQVAHFKYKNAKASLNFLHRRFGYHSLMRHVPHHYYNVRITGVKDMRTARAIIRKIRRRGFQDAYILARRRPPASK